MDALVKMYKYRSDILVISLIEIDWKYLKLTKISAIIGLKSIRIFQILAKEMKICWQKSGLPLFWVS